MELSKFSVNKWITDIELIDTNLETEKNAQTLEALSLFASQSQSAERAVKMQEAIATELQKELSVTIPWFLNEMPLAYMHLTPFERQMDHVTALTFSKANHDEHVNEVRNLKEEITTLIAPKRQNELAQGSIKTTPATILAGYFSKPAFRAKEVRIFTALNQSFAICDLRQASFKKTDCSVIPEERREKIFAASSLSKEIVEKNLSYLDLDFILNSTIKQISIVIDIINESIKKETSYLKETIVEVNQNKHVIRVDLGFKNFLINDAVENVVNIFNRYGFVVLGIFGVEAWLDEKTEYSAIHAIVEIHQNKTNEMRFSPQMREWGKIVKSLKTLTYVDHGDEFSALMKSNVDYSLNETSLIRAMAHWTHVFLTKQNPYYYSLERVSHILVTRKDYLEISISYFRARFDPRFQEDRESSILAILNEYGKIIADISSDIEKNVLKEGFNFIKGILKTNYFKVSKGCLAFRIDPIVLNKADYPEIPYGIFFVIGRNFRGFQVRYRDIARGGVRVVLPHNDAEYENALAGLFDEVNGLAFAQQMKNKDIPEGGSKCVIVVKPLQDKSDAVKSAVSGIMDLIIVDEESKKLPEEIIDYYGKEEIIYLGPDENLTNDLIDWIIRYALERKYRYAYAFMSSKPDFGINHKHYGVTSEGVNVYLDNVLEFLDLKGKSFRVKMTGGPDGDVAGNELKILYREYGELAKVIAIADGSGAAFDPNGLSWKGLLALVAHSKPVTSFDASLLSKDTGSFLIEANNPTNAKIRNTLYANIEAEIFIPAGGRPFTVNDQNWSQYLLPDGRPSSLAIIEGANIFFTSEARKNLVKSGVLVIKDSSANKAGVICSSYEIIACLTLTPGEFAEIKDIYVKQVIDILKEKANNEAKLLLREWQRHKNETDLVQLSYDISHEINLGKDILLQRLEHCSEDELNNGLFKFVLFAHCPQILVEKYDERIIARLPRKHKIAIISVYMSSHLIYKEGLKWLDTMSDEQIFRVALDYVQAERDIQCMVEQLENTEIEYKSKVIDILKSQGARYFATRIL